MYDSAFVMPAKIILIWDFLGIFGLKNSKSSYPRFGFFEDLNWRFFEEFSASKISKVFNSYFLNIVFFTEFKRL